ncbi:hypothetical protein ABZ611_33915 [Streptomyces sp. NPDC007861]|uniref:hypothetical protein n=1 Tax=Streptomyces sp. NPDC007861 TaxID=3154893 RepID=UPI0033DFE661
MSARLRPTSRRRALVAVGTTAVLALVLAACGGSGDDAMSGMHHGTKTSVSASPTAPSTTAGTGHGGHDMDAMKETASDDGLAAQKDGYRLGAAASALPAGAAAAYRFTIAGPDGKPVTDFAVDQTKRLHFYAIRSDLTGFQHLHPTMAADGTWAAPLAALKPGTWRMYASFTPASGPGKGEDLVLSTTATVPGTASDTALPKASGTTAVDGYTVTVTGRPTSGTASPLTVTITRASKPVTDLQPYLDTYAHLTAFHAGDQALAHLHPETVVSSGQGGPSLTFHAELPKSGDWRLFLQFQTAGTLHTAALTLNVG